MWKQTHAAVYIRQEEWAAKHSLFICQVPDKELSWQARVSPQQSRGALFSILTCPVYAQRLMLFANHILWKFTNGARHATPWVCQPPSQQLAVSLTVCGSVRKQLSLSICLAVTFSNTCVLCLHAWGLSSLRGLPSSLWIDKTPTLPLI